MSPIVTLINRLTLSDILPTHLIQVKEYECLKCRYKWINRINGKDGAEPLRCAKCKRTNWNQGSFTPKETGLRTRIKNLKTLYRYQGWHWNDETLKHSWPEGLNETFLNLDPRPTIAELKQVLYGGKLRLNSQHLFRGEGFVLDPKKPGWMKYDVEAYKKLIKEDAQTQQALMKRIIDYRKPSVK